MNKVLITTEQLMKKLQIKKRETIYSYIKQGMPNIKLGKSYMFDFDEVIEWFKARG
jgi:predicted DNA-binding transcriptional regulator AlpA